MQTQNYLMLLVTLSLMACNAINIFDGGDNGEPTEQNQTSGLLLSVRITGGLAGVNQELQVEENGTSSFDDSFLGDKRFTIELSESELADLDTLMLRNDFFLLEDEYIDPNVADAFLYEITYGGDDSVKTVLTDNFAAPTNLKSIVSGVNALAQKTRNNGLELTLQLSQSEIGSGETIDLTLTVENTTVQALLLNFSDGQIFDFTASRSNSTGQQKVFWNWAHDQAFTAALWEMQLEPGGTKSYEVTWNGRDNSGVQLSGELFMRADLVSLPGGRTEPQTLTIKE